MHWQITLKILASEQNGLNEKGYEQKKEEGDKFGVTGGVKKKTEIRKL